MDARRWFYQTQLTSDEMLSGHNIQRQGILKNKTQGEKRKQKLKKNFSICSTIAGAASWEALPNICTLEDLNVSVDDSSV